MRKVKKSRRPERVSRESADVLAERIAELERAFPEAVSEGKVDFDKLRTTLGDEVDGRAERYSFSWAGKRDCIRLLQTPSRATLVPAREESVDFDTTQNLFIEGDNLEVLKLLYKSYFGRVKMIYIDPPYNTGKDFIYPDNFADPLDTYLKLTGQKDSEGNVLTSNPETSGRYHSAWLSMMYPRLFIARQLLSEDGVIFISIDDNEVHNLRMLANEVFGEESFVADIVAVNNLKGRNDKKYIATAHERLLMYARQSFEERGLELPDERLAEFDQEDSVGKYRLLGLRKRGGADTRVERPKLFFPIYVNTSTKQVSLKPFSNGAKVLPMLSDGREGCWRWGADKVLKNLHLLVADQVGSTGRYDVFVKNYLQEDGEQRRMKPKSVWFGSDVSTDGATKAFHQLMPDVDFSNPKPVAFVKDLLDYATDDDEIVMDFFAGACPLAEATLELNRADGGNRRFVVVQLPEPLPEPGKKFRTIADIGKERIRRVIAKMKKEQKGKLDLKERATPEDLGFRVFKLTTSNYRQFEEKPADKTDLKKYARQMAMFRDALVEGWKPENVIYEVAIKEGFGLNCRIEEANRQDAKDAKSESQHKGTKSTKKTGGIPGVYRVTDPDKEQSLYICLDDEIRLESLRFLNLKKDDLLICRDKALDDEAAANLTLQCRLKTI